MPAVQHGVQRELVDSRAGKVVSMTVRRSVLTLVLALAAFGGWVVAPAAADDPSVSARGAASAWGKNDFGQLGDNTTTNSSVPVAVNTTGTINGEPVTAISAGDSHTCAVAGGRAYCWGRNWAGQLGNNSTTDSDVPVPVDTSGVLTGTVTSIGAGRFHTCAVAGGEAFCWGDNSSGQLGRSSIIGSDVPVAVDTSGVLTGTVSSISSGAFHTCATADDEAFCWGDNSSGQLGDGSTTTSDVPVAVDTSGVLTGTVSSISSGAFHTCATADDKAFCWGDNTYGPLGNGSTTSSDVPVAVDTSGVFTGTVAAIDAGFGVTCAVSDGWAYCWGDNRFGQLGDNSTTQSEVPVPVDTNGALTGPVTSISGGDFHTCAVGGGKASCWGGNGSGQLGNNSTTASLVPVAVDTSGVLSGTVSAISLAGDQSVALSVSPNMSLSPAGLSFSTESVGASSPEQIVTVTNVGGADLSVSTITLGGVNPGEFTRGTDTCTGPVAPAGSCTVKVRFAPTSTGNKTATLTFASNAPGSPHTITLTGTGVQATMSVAPNPVVFPGQLVRTSGSEQKVLITNTGTAALTVSGVSLAGADPGQFSAEAGTCASGPVAPTSTCAVVVRFAPTSTGNKEATLTFASNAPGSPTVRLSGTATAPQSGKRKQILRPGLPARIKLAGLTLITPANARTNAGQRVRTIVRGGPAKPSAAGEVRDFTIVRGPRGETSVRTFGRTDLRLIIIQKAPATAGYTALRRSARYLGGERQ